MEDSGLKKAGLKITLPRLKVLEVLENHEPHHMSAEEVTKYLSNESSVGLATVSGVNNLRPGIVERHNFDDGCGLQLAEMTRTILLR